MQNEIQNQNQKQLRPRGSEVVIKGCVIKVGPQRDVSNNTCLPFPSYRRALQTLGSDSYHQQFVFNAYLRLDVQYPNEPQITKVIYIFNFLLYHTDIIILDFNLTSHMDCFTVFISNCFYLSQYFLCVFIDIEIHFYDKICLVWLQSFIGLEKHSFSEFSDMVRLYSYKNLYVDKCSKTHPIT